MSVNYHEISANPITSPHNSSEYLMHSDAVVNEGTVNEGAVDKAAISSGAVIVSNHQTVPAIRVNQCIISGEKISAEMQYHPADTHRKALLNAAESLIINELLRQRATELQLVVSRNPLNASDNDFIDALLAADITLPKASESECEHYYQHNTSRFFSSPLLEVRHILLASAADDEEGRVAGKDQASALITALKKGADFAVLARSESACPSKDVGGSLGQISKGQTVPEFERQVFSAGPGLMPRPVESRYGFHIVLIDRKIAGVQLPYAVVKEKIADYLNEKVRTKAIAQYIHRLIARADIEGYDFGLSASPLMQ